MSTAVKDYSEYLKQLSEAKKSKNIAALRSAYEKSVAQLQQAGSGLDGEYRQAKNTAAGQSAQAGCNFAQYAAANGLANGAAGQARLARSITLQNNLNALDREKAGKQADLAAKQVQAGIDYETGAAQARADADAELAQALYQEQIRQEEAAYQLGRDAVEDQRWQTQQDYQANRDAVADQRWQSQQDYQAGRDAVADQRWQSQQDYQASRDAVADQRWQSQQDYQANRDAVADQRWQTQQDYQASRDAAEDEQWRQELDFAIQKFWYGKGGSTSASDEQGSTPSKNNDSSSASTGTVTPPMLLALANQVLRGEWGNGSERVERLTMAGYDPVEVQRVVDSLLAGK